jgi:acyl-CoA synthetase (NDP forming)
MENRADQVIRLISLAQQNREVSLNPMDANAVLGAYGIETVKSVFVNANLDEVVTAAEEIGFPLVLKLISQKLLHKSDAGLVHLGIHDKEGVRRAYHEILKNKERADGTAEIKGFLVQRMLQNGYEVIVGLAPDPTFGKILLFGMGGVFVEILKDVAIRKIPIRRSDARDMIEEIKGYQILKGARGKEPANLKYLEELLLNVSQLGMEAGQIKEMDLNPVLVDSQKASVADIRIIIQ